MSKRDYKTDEEREIEAGIRANWQPTVEAAGMYHPTQDTFTLFMLGGFLMRDEVVATRRHSKLMAFRPTAEEPYMPSDATVAVLKAMTPRELKELQERILKKTAPMQRTRTATQK